MKNFLKAVIAKSGVVNVLAVLIFIFWIFPIRKNRVVFQNFKGKQYGDSLKYIAEEFRRNGEYELYWIANKKERNSMPSDIKTVRKYSIRYFYVVATSKFWVSNTHLDVFFIKRKKQYYVQTWHGGLALKKIELDAIDKLSDYYKKEIELDARRMDLMVSNGTFCTAMYRRAFGYNGEILECGTPRNDCLINERDVLSRRARKQLRLDDTEVLLYAPTFRNDYGRNPYDIDLKKMVEKIELITGKRWMAIVKLHPLIEKHAEKLFKYDEKIVDASGYADVQELICLSSLIVTDYSSIMFESMIAEKPVILYANDIDEYEKERGYYFAFKDLPFPLVRNNDELLKEVSSGRFLDYLEKYRAFEEKVGLIEKGKASKLVFERMTGEIISYGI